MKLVQKENLILEPTDASPLKKKKLYSLMQKKKKGKKIERKKKKEWGKKNTRTQRSC